MGIVSQSSDTLLRPSPDSRLKVHLRLLAVGGSTYRVITLRPSTRIAFSTNFYHQTWHIVTSQRGARLLARLLWGLAYQRRPNTFVLIHGEHLLPTPFDAERSDPFLLVPGGLSRLDPSALRVLKSRLGRLGPPTQTIRWQTFGLDAVLQTKQAGPNGHSPVEEKREWLWWEKNEQLWKQERMERLGGFIVYSAPSPILRRQALSIHGLRLRKDSYTTEMNYHYLAESSAAGSWWPEGEVQIFAGYMDRVASAVEARQELLPNPKQRIISETVEEAISQRRDRINARRGKQKRPFSARSSQPFLNL
jgi:hypothetical protein